MLQRTPSRRHSNNSFQHFSIDPQDSRPLPLASRRLLPLVALLESRSLLVTTAQVVVVLDLEDSDDPVLTGEGFLERVQLRALSRQARASDAVHGLTAGEELVVVVVRHLVHKRVAHSGRSLVVDAILATRGEVVALVDLVRPDTFSDPDHPQELVDVVTRVPEQSTENDKHVVNLVLLHDRVRHLLPAGHGLANSRDVSVVPGVVVDQRRTVGHTTNLVAVVPPTHNLSSLRGVLSQPVVRLTVVIDDVLATV